MVDNTNNSSQHFSTTQVDLTINQERSHIHPKDHSRYIVLSAHVRKDATPVAARTRLPLSLALVLDRSGSMEGAKLRTAKQAVLSVLDHLTAEDTLSLIAFDSDIETVQGPAAVTPQLKSRVREALQALQARTATALHEGWLTGCNSIADSAGTATQKGLARCFLLTDGLANVGVTDPERIASEAAGIREHVAISTSTFGVGSDYNELLLGPMAVAGGGQFHHLRSPEDMITTFVGELGSLLTVAALQVCLEVETAAGVELDLISPYWMRSAQDNPVRRVISIGDLQSDEERPVVIRCAFPEWESQEPQIVRARLTWRVKDVTCATAWQEVRFSYASQQDCESEARDPQVMHWVAQHEADRARREAVASNNRGDVAEAQEHLKKAVTQLSTYAPGSATTQSELSSLQNLAAQMAQAPMAPAAAKEVYYSQQRRSRNQTDYRQTTQDSAQSEPAKKEPAKKEPAKKEQQPLDQSQKGRRKIKLPWQGSSTDDRASH